MFLVNQKDLLKVGICFLRNFEGRFLTKKQYTVYKRHRSPKADERPLTAGCIESSAGCVKLCVLSFVQFDLGLEIYVNKTTQNLIGHLEMQTAVNGKKFDHQSN